MIYLDNNATTRVHPQVAAAMMPFLTERFANPSSAIGQFAGLGRSVGEAKREIAQAISAESPEQIVVTSGATEANNLALLGAAQANPSRRHLIVSEIEHPSVLEVARYLESTGYHLTTLVVGSAGAVSPESVYAVLRADTLLVSVMFANNESGVISPIGSIADAIKRQDPSILVHTDATQAVGKIDVDLCDRLAAVDFLSFSAHKFHGPKGVGTLFVRDRETILPIQFGGGQQGGLRSGTEAPAAVVGMATALTAAVRRLDCAEGTSELRDRLERGVRRLVPRAQILGADSPRLPNTSLIHLPGMDGGELVDFMATNGIAISTGSACAHGAQAPSYVARSMGLDHAAAQQCVRISMSCETTSQDIEGFLSLLTDYANSKAQLARST